MTRVLGKWLGFLEQGSGIDLGQLLFGVLGKVAFHHPIVILGFGSQHVGHGFAFVFSEIEYLDTVFPDEASSKIDDGFLADGLEDAVDIITELGISFYLCLQDLVRCRSICFGAVSVFQHLFAIKFIGSAKGTGFHFIKNGLHVEQPPTFHIKIYLCPKELFHQQGNVESVGIIAGQVAAIEHLFDLLRELLEGGGVFDHFIGDAVNGTGGGGNGHLGIDEFPLDAAGAIGEDLDDGDLDDPVVSEVDPGGFQVDECQGLGQLQHE